MQKASQKRINLSCNLKNEYIFQTENVQWPWQAKGTAQAKNGVLSNDTKHKSVDYVQETITSLVGGVEDIYRRK